MDESLNISKITRLNVLFRTAFNELKKLCFEMADFVLKSKRLQQLLKETNLEFKLSKQHFYQPLGFEKGFLNQ